MINTRHNLNGPVAARRSLRDQPAIATRTAIASRPRAFTLIELLVVIGIIATLAVMTVMSVTRISRDGRVAMGVNQVMAALGEGRARAIKESQPILVTFRARTDPAAPARGQVTDIIVARWTGQLIKVEDGGPNNPTEDVWNIPFEQHPETVRRSLPPGIKIAGPRSDFEQDGVWITQPELNNNEFGRSPGVLFGPDGTVITRFPKGVGVAKYELAYLDVDGLKNSAGFPVQNYGSTTGTAARFYYNDEVDESSTQYVRALAVFDDAAAREVFVPSKWSGDDQASGDSAGMALPADCSNMPSGQSRMRCEQSQFINQFAERINFNRFTGVAEVVKR